jgi:hypothetical protein
MYAYSNTGQEGLEGPVLGVVALDEEALPDLDELFVIEDCAEEDRVVVPVEPFLHSVCSFPYHTTSVLAIYKDVKYVAYMQQSV